jgi:hypothetical protein
MTTVKELFTDLRYDLNDQGKQKFDDTYLLNMLNRGVRVIDRELISIGSELPLDIETATLSTGENSLDVSSEVDNINRVYIDQIQLFKTTREHIHMRRIHSIGATTGRPAYFAVWSTSTFASGRTLEFDYAADRDYTLTYVYNKLVPKLDINSLIPYDNMFYDYLREGIVTLCLKAKENRIVQTDFMWRELFRQHMHKHHVAITTPPKYSHKDF